MEIIDGNNKEETQRAIDELGVSKYPFKLDEFKEVLTEFNCINDYKVINEYPNIIDVKERLGMPDYLFVPKIEEVPVCITIHMNRNLYAITSIYPNPRKDAELPYCFGIQIVSIDEDKYELKTINEITKNFTKFLKQRGKL